jgi:histidinol-phosphate aminotransferase
MTIKHKQWVDKVVRVRDGLQVRFGLTRLDKNERVSPFPSEFLQKLLAGISSEHLAAYPETEALYERLAQHHQVEVSNLMITAGSDAGIRHCFELFVDHGDEVVTLDPTFAMVDIYCRLYGGVNKTVGYDKDLNLNLELLLDAIGPKTSLVILANPNSPTGTLISEAKLKVILEKSARFNVPVLIDEAYFGFCKQTAVPLLSEFDNLIIGRTFSKAYGLAGLRVGYLLANAELAQLLYRFRPMYEINSIGVHAAIQMLDNPQLVDDYLEETEAGRQFLLDFLRTRGIDFRDTKTNFVHIDFLNRKKAALEEFDKSGILVRGGLAIDGYENFLRVSIGPVIFMKKVVEAMQRIGI